MKSPNAEWTSLWQKTLEAVPEIQSKVVKRKPLASDHGFLLTMLQLMQQKKKAQLTDLRAWRRWNCNCLKAFQRLTQKHFLIDKRVWLESKTNLMERSWRMKDYQKTLKQLACWKNVNQGIRPIVDKDALVLDFDGQVNRWAIFMKYISTRK